MAQTMKNNLSMNNEVVKVRHKAFYIKTSSSRQVHVLLWPNSIDITPYVSNNVFIVAKCRMYFFFFNKFVDLFFSCPGKGYKMT